MREYNWVLNDFATLQKIFPEAWSVKRDWLSHYNKLTRNISPIELFRPRHILICLQHENASSSEVCCTSYISWAVLPGTSAVIWTWWVQISIQRGVFLNHDDYNKLENFVGVLSAFGLCEALVAFRSMPFCRSSPRDEDGSNCARPLASTIRIRTMKTFCCISCLLPEINVKASEGLYRHRYMTAGPDRRSCILVRYATEYHEVFGQYRVTARRGLCKEKYLSKELQKNPFSSRTSNLGSGWHAFPMQYVWNFVAFHSSKVDIRRRCNPLPGLFWRSGFLYCFWGREKNWTVSQAFWVLAHLIWQLYYPSQDLWDLCCISTRIPFTQSNRCTILTRVLVFDIATWSFRGIVVEVG